MNAILPTRRGAAPSGRNHAHWWLLVPTLAGFLLMVGFEAGTASACERVTQLQLQFAWSAARARAVLECWGPEGVAGVVAGLYADFLFLAGYAPLLALLVARARLRFDAAGVPAPWTAVGRGLAAAQILAGLLDALENGLLLAMLHGRLAAEWASAVGGLAALKFALIAAGLAYLAAAGVAGCRGVRRGAVGDREPPSSGPR